MVTSGGSQAGSGGSSKSSFAVRRERPGTEQDQEHGDNLLDRRSSLEYGVFGVLFTLSKEKSEHRIRYRWVLLKVLLDGWQLFTTVIAPHRQHWSINSDGTAWAIVGVLNFTWLADLGYNAYLAVLYTMLALLAVNIGMCVWVAWCFKEQKFPVVWPIKVLRVFSSVFFQAFDVASLNLLQLGITCRFNGNEKPLMRFDLFPEYKCTAPPHIMHAVVSALCLVLFVAIALLLNMAEVEVNPLSRRPMALGHSGAEVMAFGIKVLLTLVNVFLGWERVEACVYLALSLALAWQTLRWNAHLVSWVNHLKAGVYLTVVWCSGALMLLVFHPGMRAGEEKKYRDMVTVLLLAGLAPAFVIGALLSWASLRLLSASALKSLDNPNKQLPLSDVFSSVDEPRDIEIAYRCCRKWKEPGTLDPDAVNKAHQLIKAGLVMFPNSAFMVLLHANFMIDVLGVSQSGSRRIEDARKLNPSLMCRFIMFVRQQQATQNAAGNSVNSSASMDLLGYVEYQRKQRMVVRLHREALQAMCNFWKALDASSVSFTHLSKALGKIETSVSQAQRAYRVVLDTYGNNPKLVHLYGRFLQTIKNDPWHAAEYFAEAERLEELQDSNASGPLMPDGTPLSRMDEIDTAVLVLNAAGEVQMANRHTQFLFGYKRGVLEGKPLATLLAPHFARRLSERLASIATANELLGIAGAQDGSEVAEEMVVGLHCDRLAFPAKLSLRKASGVGEDSTIIALIEPVPLAPGASSVWVTHNGIVTACDPSFVANFGWKATEVNGTSIKGLITSAAPKHEPTTAGGSGPDQAKPATAQPRGGARNNESASELIKRLLAQAAAATEAEAEADGGLDDAGAGGVSCLVPHKYMRKPVACTITIVASASTEAPVVHELRIKTDGEPVQMLAVNRKGVILHASSELATRLKDRSGMGLGTLDHHAGTMLSTPEHGGEGMHGGEHGGSSHAAMLNGYTLFDFLPPAWKEMHFKLLKDITTVSPLPVAEMACRKSGLAGTTMELRTAGGRELYMRVGVSTNEIQGEIVHIVHMARSSLEGALAERRLRLRLSPDGLIAAVEAGNSSHLFGLDANKVVGRGLWEIVEETSQPPPAPTGGASNTILGPRNSAGLVSRALRYPGHSWRAQVVPPPSRAARASFTPLSKPAVMQLHVTMPADDDEEGAPIVFVDLWPLTTVVGVLDLDPYGRVRAVLEERTRPAGLLFGVPSQSLVGSMLGELVALPPGRVKPGDLLSLHAAKKSSLKSHTQAKEASVKVGPVHVLRATHLDGQPLSLDVQVVGKPGPGESVTAILKTHLSPAMPRLLAAPLPHQSAATIPPAAPAPARAPPGVATTTVAGAATALSRVGSLRPGEASSGVGLALIDAPAKAPSPVVMTPQRTSSLEDTKPRSPILWCPPPAGAAASGLPLQQQPPVVRALSTPPTSKTPPVGLAPPDYALLDAPYVEPPPDSLPGSAGAADGTLTSPPPTADAQAQAAQLLGRSKLGSLVKSVGGDPGSGSSRQMFRIGDGSGEANLNCNVRLGTPMGRGGGGGAVSGSGGREYPSLTKGRASFRMPSAVRQSDYLDDAEADMEEEDGGGGRGEGVTDSAGSDSDRSGARPGQAQQGPKAGRVLEWVASKGAYYQNSINDSAKGGERYRGASREGFRRPSYEGDGGAAPAGLASPQAYGDGGMPYQPDSAISETRVGVAAAEIGGVSVVKVGRGVLGPSGLDDMATSYGGEGDDDAGSDGGQSAVSGAQSATGSEYTRGKRFRKLAKLMDSSQTKTVQSRLRIHTLLTVALLATVHVTCFVLTVMSIKSQQASMMQLGRSGQAQLYMHRILIDVRTLDIISRGKWRDNLYKPEEAPAFIQRISQDAEEIKVRFNEILNSHANSPDIIKILYQTKRTVWDTNDADGSDIYTNLTIWDFGTRFYSMAKSIQQLDMYANGETAYIADTYPGQFLLKSGPDLFIDCRKILEALLYNAVDNARRVDVLQIVFLLVEGAAISFMAACYLTYLLRAVAAQRFKLYSTFLVIPVGLTRALASQNTNLLVDDDDDDDSDEEDERAAQAVIQEAEEGGGAATPKLRRRATLKVEESAEQATPVMSPIAVSGGAAAAGGWRRSSVEDPSVSRKPSYTDKYDKYDKMRTMTTESVEERALSSGCCGWFGWRSRLRHVIARRSSILPLPLSVGGSTLGANPALASMGNGKRSLRFDSNETIFMLLPFIFWSALVIAIYATAVVKMQGVDEVVAIHSVVNIMSAQTSRTVFFGQELCIVEDPNLLLSRRAALKVVVKMVRDAWYTLQLGDQAYTAVGDDAERYPLVTKGLSHASPDLTRLFYSSGICHRVQENLPCLDPTNRFYQVAHTGLDSMMQQFMISLSSMAMNTSMVPEGLGDEHWDFVYNVGYKDLLDGTVRIAEAHYDTILSLFNNILILHILLFLLFWVIFGGFLIFMLNPLLNRVSQERRRIAELMSQLPLELDVERLVARALGTAGSAAHNGGVAGGDGDRSGHMGAASGGGYTGGGGGGGGEFDATSKWKAIIRASSLVTGKGQSMDGRKM